MPCAVTRFVGSAVVQYVSGAQRAWNLFVTWPRNYESHYYIVNVVLQVPPWRSWFTGICNVC